MSGQPISFVMRNAILGQVYLRQRFRRLGAEFGICRVGAATAPVGRAEGHAVGWRAARRSDRRNVT